MNYLLRESRVTVPMKPW